MAPGNGQGRWIRGYLVGKEVLGPPSDVWPWPRPCVRGPATASGSRTHDRRSLAQPRCRTVLSPSAPCYQKNGFVRVGTPGGFPCSLTGTVQLAGQSSRSINWEKPGAEGCSGVLLGQEYFPVAQGTSVLFWWQWMAAEKQGKLKPGGGRFKGGSSGASGAFICQSRLPVAAASHTLTKSPLRPMDLVSLESMGRGPPRRVRTPW